VTSLEEGEQVRFTNVPNHRMLCLYKCYAILKSFSMVLFCYCFRIRVLN